MSLEIQEERFFSLDNRGEVERKNEVFFRPGHLDEYIGQHKLLQNVKIMMESANLRGDALEHILFSGPPGLGKTSLAMLMAKVLKSELHVISGPALEKKGDLAAILSNLGARDVLFIDEIHRMHISIEEILYSAMEDYRLDIVIGQGAGARTMQIDLAPFTLIGATTKSGLLSNPLRDRFVASLHFDFYPPSDLSVILANNARKLKLSVEKKALELMASCSRGTPRIANRILKRVRDFAVVQGESEISLESVIKALELMDIDTIGLDGMDRKILTVIRDYYGSLPFQIFPFLEGS